MRLLVFGTRTLSKRTGQPVLFRILNHVWAEWDNQRNTSGDNEFVIISGDSRDKYKNPVGPDAWAIEWADTYKIPKLTVSIEDIGGWQAHPGKRAAFIRNKTLLEHKPTHALGLWDGKSRGTRMMHDLVVKVRPRIRKRIITPDMYIGYPFEWK